MRIGIPKEIKPREGRVSLTPADCAFLVAAGHAVFIEQSAGLLSGFSNEQYEESGVSIVGDAASVYRQAKLIVKVKEPVENDLRYLNAEHLLFSFLHLAANPALTRQLGQIGLTAVGFETVETEQGHLPLLAPMSLVAGRLAGQIGTHLLHAPQGGKGLLLGGLPTTDKGQVVVLGAGNAGAQAIDVVAKMGADVTVFDLDSDKLHKLEAQYPDVKGKLPEPRLIEEAVTSADLLVGAVLIAGKKAPMLVNESLVQKMQAGSVIIDIAVDQGGCIETIRPTNYQSPTYLLHGVLHFGVTNMPGAVPRTSSQALSAAISPYVSLLAQGQLHADPVLRRGINLEQGKVVHPALL